MPYIKKEDRQKFEKIAMRLGESAKNAGELNYIVTVIMHSYLHNKGLNYANVNEVIGALTCCNMELYRRIASPYEDKKIKENGDVNSLDDLLIPSFPITKEHHDGA